MNETVGEYVMPLRGEEDHPSILHPSILHPARIAHEARGSRQTSERISAKTHHSNTTMLWMVMA